LYGLRSGYCEMHYRRDKEGRSMALPKKGSGAHCVVDGCDRKAEARGMCDMHRIRTRKHGEPGAAAPLHFPQDVCAVEGCERRAASKQLCRMHLQRQYARGDTGPSERLRRPNGEGHLNRYGYREITIDGHRQFEHRFVMEQILGRPLNNHEHVHHRNGVRSDNRPENLELWVKGHPYGQRPHDLIAFVIENYPDAVRAALLGQPLALNLF
jgi:hypothetical protein